MSAPSPARRLRPSERIRHRAEFQRVYGEGTRIHGRFMTLFFLPTSLPHSRLGIAATRKLGGAVQRNRVKRLAREIYRHHKPAGRMAYDVVVVPRREMLDASYAALEMEFCDKLARIVR